MDNLLGNEIPELETERYLLRGMTENDAAKLYTIMSDRETMKFITPHPVKSVKQMEEDIKTSIHKFAMKTEIPWVIIHKQTKELIGMFRFHKLHFWHKKAELGAIVKVEYQKTGVMTEIFTEALSFGFNELKLNRIVGDIFEGNQGSEKLLNKFGFHKDGQLRQTDFDGEKYHDTIVFSLLRTEYKMR